MFLSITLTNIWAVGNVARTSGGALHVERLQGRLYIGDSYFADNAADNGGAVAVVQALPGQALVQVMGGGAKNNSAVAAGGWLAVQSAVLVV